MNVKNNNIVIFPLTIPLENEIIAITSKKSTSLFATKVAPSKGPLQPDLHFWDVFSKHSPRIGVQRAQSNPLPANGPRKQFLLPHASFSREERSKNILLSHFRNEQNSNINNRNSLPLRNEREKTEKKIISATKSITEITNSERHYYKNIRLLTKKAFEGKSILNQLINLADLKTDRIALRKFRTYLKQHIKHIDYFLQELEIAETKMLNDEYPAGMAAIQHAYENMDAYIEGNFLITDCYKEAQNALNNIRKQYPANFAALQEMFQTQSHQQTLSTVMITPIQRMPKHALVAANLIQNGSIEKNNRTALKKCLRKIEKANIFADLGINPFALAQSWLIPTQEMTHPLTQTFLKRIAEGDEEARHLLIWGAGAVWGRDQLNDINLCAQICLSYPSLKKEEEKLNLLYTLRDYLTTKASLPLLDEEKRKFKGYLQHLLFLALKEQKHPSMTLGLVVKELYQLSEEHLQIIEKTVETNDNPRFSISEIEELVNTITEYNIKVIKPSHFVKQVHAYLTESIVQTNISELDRPGALSLNPTLNEVAARSNIVSLMVAQQIRYSDQRSKVYKKVVRAAIIAQKSEDWASCQAIVMGLMNASLIRYRLADKLSQKNQHTLERIIESLALSKLKSSEKEAIQNNLSTPPLLAVYAHLCEFGITGNALVDSEEKLTLDRVIHRLQMISKIKQNFHHRVELVKKSQTEKKSIDNAFINATKKIAAAIKFLQSSEVIGIDNYKPNESGQETTLIHKSPEMKLNAIFWGH